MKHYGNIDLDKFGQLINALLHKLPDLTTANTEITATGQIGFSEAEGRITYFDGTTLRQIASISDLSGNGNKIFVSETDPALVSTIVDGDGWFKPSTSTLQIRDTTWKSTSSTTTFIIPSWSANTDFESLAVVIFNSQLWRNETGTTNNDIAWTPSNWVRIGGIALNKAVATITPAILNNTTVGNVTRISSTYSIVHNLGTTNVIVRILENDKILLTDTEIVDSNTVNIMLNTDAQTSGKTYDIIIAEI